MRKSTRDVLVICGLAVAAALVLALTLMRPHPFAPAAAHTSLAVERTPPAAIPAADVASLASAPQLLFRHAGMKPEYNPLSIAPLAKPDSGRAVTDLQCDRVSFAGGRGICLQANRGLFTTFRAVLFDERFQPGVSVKLDGRPSRTRLSPDGRYGAITVFVSGHGYTSVSFSTKTTVLDMASAKVLGDLEQFETWRDGQRFSANDFNFWGVTFARDSNTFYATLMTAGKMYLVRGDVPRRTLTVVHENVECPSLSPDNRLIAYKKRVGGDLAAWRFYILDLATMAERPLAAETRSIDDQIEWLDDAHVLYAAPRSSQSAIRDVWVAPIDDSRTAQPFVSEAESPVVVR